MKNRRSAGSRTAPSVAVEVVTENIYKVRHNLAPGSFSNLAAGGMEECFQRAMRRVKRASLQFVNHLHRSSTFIVDLAMGKTGEAAKLIVTVGRNSIEFFWKDVPERYETLRRKVDLALCREIQAISLPSASA